MALRHLGFIDLPAHAKAGGFDHAAVHEPTGRIYVAHTANDAVDVIDVRQRRCVGWRARHRRAGVRSPRRADDGSPPLRIDGSRVVHRADPIIGAHRDIYHDEITTLVLLAGGLLRGAHQRPKTSDALGCALTTDATSQPDYQQAAMKLRLLRTLVGDAEWLGSGVTPVPTAQERVESGA